MDDDEIHYKYYNQLQYNKWKFSFTFTISDVPYEFLIL